MKKCKMSLIPVFLVLIFAPVSLANEAYLSMCIRDTKNVIGSADRAAKANDFNVLYEFQKAWGRFQRVEKTCFTAKKAESIKSLPGFAKVIEHRDTARVKLKEVEKRVDALEAKAKADSQSKRDELNAKKSAEEKRWLEKKAEKKRKADVERKRQEALEKLPTGIFWKDFKPGMKNRGLEKKAMSAIQKHVTAGKWEEKYTKIKIESEDWSIRRNALGIILQREINAWVLGTWPDGKCKVKNFTFAQEYNGSDYNQSVILYAFGRLKRIDCD